MDFILGVDLDNVTADYTAGIAQFMHEEYGWREEDTPPPTDYDFIKAAGWPFADRADFLQKHQEFVDRGGLLGLKVMEGASETLHALVAEGVKIRVITHRLLRNGTYTQVMSDTGRWLDAHHIPFHEICFTGLKASINVNLLIDDAPENISAVRAAGMPVAVFDQSYNQQFDGLRVRNWEEVGNLVRNMMNGSTGMTNNENAAKKPIIQQITSEEAQHELKRLTAQVDDMEDFADRARRYELSPEEVAVWEQIDDLRWLLGEDARKV